MLDVVGGVFHNDDGVIHHDADAQDQGEQGHQIDAEAQHHHGREGADNGHRHGGGRHQCRPPVLQKHQDDDEHQEAGFKQRLIDISNSLLHELGGVVMGCVSQARGEVFAHLLHRLRAPGRRLPGH